ncbi:MAG: hypothetical protein HPZ91_04270 [Lentisphaeria bacterium]|nr:hypothetical protein [Lentisphaeria bacterium]
MADYHNLKLGTTEGTDQQELTLQNGDTAINIAIFPGGKFQMEAGSTASSITLESEGQEPGGTLGIAGSASYITATTGAIRVSSGGSASYVQLEQAAKMNVESGGSVDHFQVQDNDSIGYDFHTTVSGTGEQGELINSTPESSFNYDISVRQDVPAGYIAYQCSVASGAVQEIMDGGEASYTTVKSGGLQLVRDGGIANATEVSGELELESGAESNYAAVANGGKMTARAGSTVNNVTLAAGGLLTLETGAEINGVTWTSGRIEASGAVDAHLLVLALTPNEDTELAVTPSDIAIPLLNDITFFRNTDLRVAVGFADQQEGEYKLAGNAAGFTGSITVTGANFFHVYTALSVGDTFTNSRRTLTLSINASDELILTIENYTGEDMTPPDPLRSITSVVCDDNSVMIHWADGSDDIGVTGYELRYYPEDGSGSKAKTIRTASSQCQLDDLKPGRYQYQVRAVDGSGKAGEWSTAQSFITVSDAGNGDAPEGPILSTTLWGHDYLPELYKPAEPVQPGDVNGFYFADAEKLMGIQDQDYCWAASTANVLTWTGWAENSQPAFANEDETFEYFIESWKNETGEQQDAFSWFLNGANATGNCAVPVEGGNLYPTLDCKDYMITVTADEAGGDFAELLLSCFISGYGVTFGIYSDQGLAHAITGWGFELKGKDIYLYYSDSDSDSWGGSSDRRDAPNRLSKTLLSVDRKDGRLYLEDYDAEGTYLGQFSALRQFDRNFLGESETFDDARRLEFNNGSVLRAGNVDGENDDDYYVFSTSFTGAVDIRVVMNSAESFISGITISLYDAAKNLLWSAAEAALEQVCSFTAAANLDYYLVVLGNAFTSDASLPLDINSYRVELSAGAEWRAGVSAEDDTWQQVLGSAAYSELVPGGAPILPEKDIFTVTVTPAGSTEEAEVPNWVGKEDKVDMRALRFEQAGSYDFSVTAVTDKLKLTVYRLENGKLKKVKGISVSAKTKEEKRGIFSLNLAADTDYIVAVQSGGKSGTNYDVSLGGEVFVNAERGDDSYELAAADPDYTVSIAKSEGAFTILNAVSLFNYNWVGFGDTADYRMLELADAGSYNFSVSTLEGRASGKFTLWQVRDNGKLKKVVTVSGSSKKEGVKDGMLLESGTYAISFESKNWKSGHNTDYTVMLDGTVFGQANQRDDNDWRNAAAVTAGEAVREEWVGFSDLRDFFRFEVAADSACSLELSGATGQDAKITLFRRNFDGKGNEKNPVKIASQRSADGFAGLTEYLSAGIYYFSVEAQGSAKKSGTNYDIDLTLNPGNQGMLA